MVNLKVWEVDSELAVKRDSLEQEIRDTWEERDICMAARLHCADSAKAHGRPIHLYREDKRLEEIAERRTRKAEGKITDLVYRRNSVREQIKEESREIAIAFARGSDVKHALRCIATQPRGNKRLWSMVRYLKQLEKKEGKYPNSNRKLREVVKTILLELPEGYYSNFPESQGMQRELESRISKLAELSAELAAYDMGLDEYGEGQEELQEEYQNLFRETVGKFGGAKQ